jgi:hypothetical protein
LGVDFKDEFFEQDSCEARLLILRLPCHRDPERRLKGTFQRT